MFSALFYIGTVFALTKVVVRWAALSWVVFALGACAGSGDSFAAIEAGLINAHDVAVGQYQSTVFLDIAGSGQCTGTVVSNRSVVTARHCICARSERAFATDITIWGGSSRFRGNCQVTIGNSVVALL